MIRKKMKQVIATCYKLFAYRGHIRLSELSLYLRTVIKMIGDVRKRETTEGMHNDHEIVLPVGQHPQVL